MGPEGGVVGGRASSRGISVVFAAFFLDASKICNNWSSTFSDVGGKSIVKLFLTFCKSHRGFTRQPVSPNVHSLHRRFKNHQNSTRRPRERKRAKMEREKRAKFWAIRRREVPRRGVEGWCPEGWCPEGWPRKVEPQTVGPRRVGAPKGGAPNCGGPKFRAFFPSPATIFILSSSLGGRFVEFVL